jgi:hypothetical protein
LTYFLLLCSGMSARRAARRILLARPNALLRKAYRESSEVFLRNN